MIRTRHRLEAALDFAAATKGPKAMKGLRGLVATMFGDHYAARFAMDCELASRRPKET